MIHELDSRITADGDCIELVWNDATDSVELRVNRPAGESLQVEVPKDRAADVLKHPYLYLPASPAGR
jgi:hypothetical protein